MGIIFSRSYFNENKILSFSIFGKKRERKNYPNPLAVTPMMYSNSGAVTPLLLNDISNNEVNERLLDIAEPLSITTNSPVLGDYQIEEINRINI